MSVQLANKEELLALREIMQNVQLMAQELTILCGIPASAVPITEMHSGNSPRWQQSMRWMPTSPCLSGPPGVRGGPPGTRHRFKPLVAPRPASPGRAAHRGGDSPRACGWPRNGAIHLQNELSGGWASMAEPSSWTVPLASILMLSLSSVHNEPSCDLQMSPCPLSRTDPTRRSQVRWVAGDRRSNTWCP